MAFKPSSSDQQEAIKAIDSSDNSRIREVARRLVEARYQSDLETIEGSDPDKVVVLLVHIASIQGYRLKNSKTTD